MADIINPGSAAEGPINTSSLPSNTDLVIIRGDYCEFFLTLKTNGSPMNLAGLTPSAVLKTGVTDPQPFNFNCILTGTPGEVRVFMSSADTKNLLSTSAYIWNFKITDALGESKTYIVGDVQVVSK